MTENDERDDERDDLHVAGDILATRPEAIAHALRAIPGGRLEVSSEVQYRDDACDLAIYPSDDGGDPRDYLVSGAIWGTLAGARRAVQRIAAALETAGILYNFELDHRDDAGERVEERFRHPGWAEFHAAKARALAEAGAATPPPGPSVDRGRIVIGERLRGGSQDEVHLGWLAADPGARMLVTLTGEHEERPDAIRHRLALAFEGVAPLEYVGATDPDVRFPDALVERLPAGQPVAPRLAEPALARLGAQIAAVAARAHAAGGVLHGIRPELVYVDAEARLTGLVPRGPAFIASAPITRGVRTYYVPFGAPEQLMANQVGAASDVFSLCATLFVLGGGMHPFGDPEQITAMLGRMMAGTISPWPGSPELGAVLARGLARNPAERPTAAALARELARLG